MIELIRQSAVPAAIMRQAARGALSLPSEEVVEILVFLTTNPVFGEQAQVTLAGWDEKSAWEIAANPATPPPVLQYLSNPRNLRPKLLSALVDNPGVPDVRLARLAALQSRDVIETMLLSERAMNSPDILRALAANPKLVPGETQRVNALLGRESSSETVEDENLLDLQLDEYLREHAAEIKASEGQPFFLHGFTLEEERELLPTLPVAQVDSETAAAKSFALAAKAQAIQETKEKQSTIQKIMKMSVGERVQLAMKGNKDERFVLVRDGSRVVCNAVIESPKLTDSEVEMFASLKNVQESVLRVIASKRKFIKNYNVIRILTANPRCPLDVSMPLLPHLLNLDLKNLSMNKNVAETVRKLAFKLFKDRTTKK